MEFLHKKTFLYIVIFVCGFCATAVEIIAARVMAPYVGTSVVVWSCIISIILAALSAGYYAGGKLSKYSSNISILLRIIFVSGVFLMLTPLMVRPVAQFITGLLYGSSYSTLITIGSLLLSLTLFALPVMLMAAVNPFCIKISSLNNPEAGSVAGTIAALSTVASIAGVLAPSLILIPLIGTVKTLLAASFLLILLGAVGWKKYFWIPLIGIAAVIIFFTARHTNAALVETDSAYHHLIVTNDARGNTFLSFDEGVGYQTVYNQKNVLTGYYYDYYNLLPYLNSSNGRGAMMLVGLAGGTIANQYHYFFPEMKLSALEIDPKVIDISKKYFNSEQSGTDIINQDARVYFSKTQGPFDVIIVDAYEHNIYIPWTLTTKEFWAQVNGSLSERGLVAMNLNARGIHSPLVETLSNTLSNTFKHVAIIKTSGTYNMMLIASNTSINVNNLSVTPKDSRLYPLAEQVIKNGITEISFDSHKKILTDDNAVIESLMQKDLLK